MSLRPVAAHWFELVTIHQELARVMECLSRTGAVELESHSRASERLLFPGMDESLKAHRDLARRYQAYWPPAAGGERRSEHLSNTLKVAQARLATWVHEADPIIAAIEHASREAADLERLRAALQSAGGNIPDIGLLAGAGPKLAVRLLALPAATLPREIPSLVLFKSWQTPQAGFALVVGRPPDIEEIETQLTGLKGRVVPIPNWLPAVPEKALAAVAERLAQVAQQRAELTARLEALSQRLDLAHALGDIALIEWLNEHAKDLRGSKRLAWVTGWTSDVGGTALRRALDACGVRYILRLSDMPQGATAPMVLSNPGWARAFEVFARMLGTPGQHETDPSQILAVIASSIFGFMFGDVGQGALVLIAGLLLGRRIPLTRMLVPGGIMAIVFGLLFGSVFCREDILPALWLRPLDQPITILIAAIVAGVVDHFDRPAARCHAGPLARRSAQLVGTSRRPALGLCGPAAIAAVAAGSGGRGRRCVVVHLWRGPGDEDGAGRRPGGGRSRVRRASPAPAGQYRVVCAHRGICAGARRAVGRHRGTGAGERTFRLLDRAGDRQSARHRAGGCRSEHSDHASLAVRVLHPLPCGRRAGVQAAAAAGHRTGCGATAKPEGHAMKLNVRIPAQILALAVIVAGGVTILLLQMDPATAQTAARPAADSSVAPWAMIAAAVAAGLSTLAAGYAVAAVGSAAVGALAEKPELLGRVLILVGLAEGIAIYGLIVAVLILNRAG